VWRIADLWAELMGGLGYARFGAQGGDFGAGVSTALGLEHAARTIGLHLNYIPGSYQPPPEALEAPPLAPEEKRFLEEADAWVSSEGGYSHVQRTKPLSLAYGMHDSPVGLAAWLAEKFHGWSGSGLERRITKDVLLTHITLYWLTETFYSSTRLYVEGRRAPMHFPKGARVRVPCGIAHFPQEAPFPPRSWVERGYDVARWTEMPRGGHFAALEEPELLAEDIRAFFRPLR
jgi:pimeloyl-ACP methyl ester carboxylesterase